MLHIIRDQAGNHYVASRPSLPNLFIAVLLLGDGEGSFRISGRPAVVLDEDAVTIVEDIAVKEAA